MLRVDGRLLAAAVAIVFFAGAGIGFGVGGSVGGVSADDPGSGTPTPEPAPSPASTAVPTTATVDSSTPTVTGTRTATLTRVPTASPTVSPTAVPTPAGTATSSPDAEATRTPMLIRRFDVAVIESEIRRLVNEWREERGLPAITRADTKLVGDLNAMARSHSVAMADAGKTIHTIDSRSSLDRYREYDLALTCRFKRVNHQYIVTPQHGELEVLAKTYAGRTYTGVDGPDYNANETAVARDVVDAWTTREPFRQRLSYRNATRLGVGIETTRDNEVYVTGNLCGVNPRYPGGE